jgi:hypothetical protein
MEALIRGNEEVLVTEFLNKIGWFRLLHYQSEFWVVSLAVGRVEVASNERMRVHHLSHSQAWA